MNTHLTRALTFLHGALMFFWKGLRELALAAYARPWITTGAIILIVAAAVGASVTLRQPAADATSTARSVTLIRVGDIAQSEPLALIGTVRSTNEAQVAPDSSGTVSGVYHGIGDYVGTGTIIASLKNDAQRASVAQAQAALQKAQSGVAVGGISAETAAGSYAAAQKSAIITIQTAYSTMDDAVHHRADESFSNPNGNNPHLNVSTSNSAQAGQTELARLGEQPLFTRHTNTNVSGLDADGIMSELTTLAAEVATTQSFMQSLVLSLNNAIASNSITDATIAGYRSDASGALASVNGLGTTISVTIDGLKAKRAAVDIANENISPGVTGESADIAAARANLAIANAGLERTLIRAPISGTINSLNIDVGSFINASVPVVYITSPGALQAVGFVSDKDIHDVGVGNMVSVGGVATGTIVRVASALDPVTKKAEVRVAIPSGTPLVSGQSATLAITRTAHPNTTGPITIPLASVKITPTGPIVFTVTGTTLVANPIILGTLNGDTVEVSSGLTLDMIIVKDARGLKDGQTITVTTF